MTTTTTTTTTTSISYYAFTEVVTQVGGKTEFIGKQHCPKHFISYLNSFGYMMK
jgi:hypothetical protein